LVGWIFDDDPIGCGASLGRRFRARSGQVAVRDQTGPDAFDIVDQLSIANHADLMIRSLAIAAIGLLRVDEDTDLGVLAAAGQVRL
jgi:hypothetical protein